MSEQERARSTDVLILGGQPARHERAVGAGEGPAGGAHLGCRAGLVELATADRPLDIRVGRGRDGAVAAGDGRALDGERLVPLPFRLEADVDRAPDGDEVDALYGLRGRGQPDLIGRRGDLGDGRLAGLAIRVGRLDVAGDPTRHRLDGDTGLGRVDAEGRLLESVAHAATRAPVAPVATAASASTQAARCSGTNRS